MKSLLTFTFIALLGVSGVAKADQNAETIAVEDMPRFASIEQQRCPKSRYPSVKKRLECKHEVRREIFEKRQAREQQNQSAAQSENQGEIQ